MNYPEYSGKGGISAKVIAHSTTPLGKQIITWEYEAPKCILAELNTHRNFSRNAQSSRAVPIEKNIKQIRENPATPIHWGSNKPGMVAGEEIYSDVEFGALWQGQDSGNFKRDEAWIYTANKVADIMESWNNAGYHKQIVNRIGEAFVFVKGVITATEVDNFFHLRMHEAADPFMQELAKCMWESYKLSKPEILYPGEWHTPYVRHVHGFDGKILYTLSDDELIKDEDLFDCEYAKKVSAAATAQVSFRKLDLTPEVVERVYSKLIDTDTPHASCLEHQAMPMELPVYETAVSSWEYFFATEGISHIDRKGNYWSGNFKGWIQNRKTLKNENCDYFKLRASDE